MAPDKAVHVSGIRFLVVPTAGQPNEKAEFTVTSNVRVRTGVDHPDGCCAPAMLRVTVPLTAVVDDVTFTHTVWLAEVGVVSTEVEPAVAGAAPVPTVVVTPAGELVTVVVSRCFRFLPAEVSSRTNDVSAVDPPTWFTVTAPGVVAV